jgi:UDP-N-acetylglucosamine enolpyruvyl transferase
VLHVSGMETDKIELQNIDNIEQIDRGYENIDVRLNQLGAKIKRI